MPSNQPLHLKFEASYTTNSDDEQIFAKLIKIPATYENEIAFINSNTFVNNE